MNVNPLPVAAGVITGTTPVCQGLIGVAYSVLPITNASGYTWNLPTGASIATGSGTNSITVNYNNTASSGNISVYGTNACGNGIASANFPVTVNPLPFAARSILVQVLFVRVRLMFLTQYRQLQMLQDMFGVYLQVQALLLAVIPGLFQ